MRTLVLVFWTVCSSLCWGQTTVLWKEDFEQDTLWDRWSVDGGQWAVGIPSSGPKTAFAGARCAATVLDGEYLPNLEGRLIRDRFLVPPVADKPRLRFWHWFRGGPGASRAVEVKVGAGAWQPLTAVSGWASDEWSRAYFDLSPFSGQQVVIAFHFQANSESQVAAGWYIDEVSVETGAAGPDLTSAPEGFENGLGSWTIDHGVWAVGAPTKGPDKALSGNNCVGTVLDGTYPPGADSRLISPEFVVPLAADNPRLRFWHWFSVFPEDPGQVEISVSGGPWQALSQPYKYNSVWTRPSLDLRPFEGQSVQVAFHFQSNADADVAAGWYIDEVVVETGPSTWDPVKQPETFESGLGNWSVDNGTWEVGVPVYGPGQAASGTQCAGTVLAQPYMPNVDSRLISPEFVVPPATDRPRLRFWQWLRNEAGDPATVEIRAVGGDWKGLTAQLIASDGTWAKPSLSLSDYAGQRVQVAFHFQSNADNVRGPGWFIDDVSVDIGPNKADFINQPETFEAGLGDWSVDKGTWELGTPDTWPDKAYSGTQCMGTVMTGSYGEGVDSRLISPEFTVPSALDNPRLRFWHWFSTWPNDTGTVEINVAGGGWQPLSKPFSGNGVIWSRPWFDLRPFGGKVVQLAFRFQSDVDGNVGRGWYVDDVVVETGPSELQSFNQAEGFEAGLGNWSVDNGTWEVGVPASGPGPAFKGINCAATVLRLAVGNYYPDTDSRLISPEFTVPCAEAGPRLRFVQWYNFASGDGGSVEVRVAGGEWEHALGPVTGSSGGWIGGSYDLSSYAGKKVQVAFRFQSNDDLAVSSGWYVDEVKIQATVLPAVDRVSVQEGSLFTYTFGSSCANVQYSLGPGAPAGVSIEPSLGIVAWVPSEDQGPGVYPIQVCAANAFQASSPIECVTMEVTVLESNSPPVLDPISDKPMQAGVPLQFTVTGYDPDKPAQRLTFSLDQGSPFGITLDPVTGQFSWTPTVTQATVAQTITVRVTDDGEPPKSAVTSFTASPQAGVSAIRVELTRVTPELISVCIDGGEVGTVYNLESTVDLNPQASSAQWTVLQTIWKGEQKFCETTHSTVNAARFYRVRQVQ